MVSFAYAMVVSTKSKMLGFQNILPMGSKRENLPLIFITSGCHKLARINLILQASRTWADVVPITDRHFCEDDFYVSDPSAEPRG